MFKITSAEKQMVLANRESYKDKLGKEIKSLLRKSSVPKSKLESAGRIRGFRRSGPGYRYKYVKDIEEIQVRLFGNDKIVSKYKKILDKTFKDLKPQWVEGEDIYVWDLIKKVKK